MFSLSGGVKVAAIKVTVYPALVPSQSSSSDAFLSDRNAPLRDHLHGFRDGNDADGGDDDHHGLSDNESFYTATSGESAGDADIARDDGACSICLGAMGDNVTGDQNLLSTPPCNHTFHTDCLERWMGEKKLAVPKRFVFPLKKDKPFADAVLSCPECRDLSIRDADRRSCCFRRLAAEDCAWVFNEDEAVAEWREWGERDLYMPIGVGAAGQQGLFPLDTLLLAVPPPLGHAADGSTTTVPGTVPAAEGMTRTVRPLVCDGDVRQVGTLEMSEGRLKRIGQIARKIMDATVLGQQY